MRRMPPLLTKSDNPTDKFLNFVERAMWFYQRWQQLKTGSIKDRHWEGYNYNMGEAIKLKRFVIQP